MLQHSVRARRDEEEEADYSSTAPHSENETPTEDDTERSSSAAESSMSDGESDTSSVEADDQISLKDISFGTLAKAQESLEPQTGAGKRKRGLDTGLNNATPRDDAPPSRPSKCLRTTSARQSRSSKHAPQTLSTRHAVPRRRTIFEPPSTLKPRDPRFDPTVISSSRDQLAVESEKVNKNYAFLTEYRQSELQSLQAQVKAAEKPASTQKSRQKGNNEKTKKRSATAGAVDEATLANMKREIQSLSARMAWSEARSREREIQRAHRSKEREDVREGRKSQAYFLKKGAVRKEVETERDQGLGKRAMEKREVRRQKREKGKEGRGMPRVRRVQ